MANPLLILGPIVFTDMEIPERLTGLGGKQMLAVKQLIGGQRIIDTMGRYDNDISWTGLIYGEDAQLRMQEIDFLRVQGLVLPLSFSELNFTVIIRDFTPVIEQTWQIPYSLTVTVVQNLNFPLGALASSFGAAIDGLMNQALTLVNLISDPTISTGFVALQTAVGNVPSFSNATNTQIANVATPLNSLQENVINSIGSLNTNLFGSSS